MRRLIAPLAALILTGCGTDKSNEKSSEQVDPSKSERLAENVSQSRQGNEKVTEYDLNRDKKPDVFKFYNLVEGPAVEGEKVPGKPTGEKKVLIRKEMDVNFDQRIDIVQYFAGDASKELYFLLSGRVTIILGQVRIVTFLAGNMFGDVAFVDGEPRSADAVCDADCRVMVLSHETLARIEAEAPELKGRVHVALALEIAARLRATDRMVREIL